jgi:two-component system, chemotaxis family, CheB/CheR fusion protein
VSAAAPSDPAFEELLDFVRDSRGFDYSGYRRPTLVRRVQRRMDAVGAATYAEYRHHVEENPEEFAELFNAILINVTGFFRDAEAWELVQHDVIPQTLGRKDDDAPIRVWSAGCASGEEPYTVAILLAEALGEQGFRERVKIYATDIDDDALTQARDATYTRKQLTNVPEDLRERYFQETNGTFFFRSDLRRAVIFGRNDLHRDPPISRVDLLVSRNTLMYFRPATQERILANFAFALNPGGFLMVGRAEALQSRTHLFTPYDLKRRVFVKDGAFDRELRVPRLLLHPDAGLVPAEPPPLVHAAFEHAPVAQLVVDENGVVVDVNQAARTLFGISQRDRGRPLQDLELSYRPVDLRSMVDTARDERRPANTRNAVWTPATGEARTLDVQVTPLTGPAGAFAGADIAFADVTAQRRLQSEVEQARRDLEAAYEELQSTVEELETTNEELQSTNEELETTNEELQSTNEELETMNEELQSTNEELETMNEELRDRTDEALRANLFLTAVLGSIGQSVIVVDTDFRVIAWSEAAAELWGLRPDEVQGEHVISLDIGIPVDRLRDPIREALAGEPVEDVTLSGHNRRGQALECRTSFAALRSLDGSVRGAILVMSAITPAA